MDYHRPMKLTRKLGLLFATSVLVPAVAIQGLSQQKVNKTEQAQGREILRKVEDTIERNYYDPKFRGIDLKANFDEAEKKMDQAPNLSFGLGIIALAVETLKDSHTYFIPPLRNVVVYPGWQIDSVGEQCLVSAVDTRSDAWKQGLRTGDEVFRLQGYALDRASLPSVKYHLDVVYPLSAYQMVVASPGKAARMITPKSEMVTLPQTLNSFTGGDARHQLDRISQGYYRVSKVRTANIGDKVMVWKLPEFNLKQTEIEHIIEQAKKREFLILDLRDNGGGGEEILKWMIESFFDHDVTVGELIERTKNTPLKVPGKQGHAFQGKLIVLVNSASASASEVFARTVQLEKRGTIVGDVTAGEVGQDQAFVMTSGGSTFITYIMEITTARLRLPDGGDLEGVGVTPDVKSLPTALDMAEERDPVLARAAQLAGVEITPEDAGKLFPVVWATH
jgi:C-terminal processing protease CtpA/Prc